MTHTHTDKPYMRPGIFQSPDLMWKMESDNYSVLTSQPVTMHCQSELPLKKPKTYLLKWLPSLCSAWGPPWTHYFQPHLQFGFHHSKDSCLCCVSLHSRIQLGKVTLRSSVHQSGFSNISWECDDRSNVCVITQHLKVIVYHIWSNPTHRVLITWVGRVFESRQPLCPNYGITTGT